MSEGLEFAIAPINSNSVNGDGEAYKHAANPSIIGCIKKNANDGVKAGFIKVWQNEVPTYDATCSN